MPQLEGPTTKNTQLCTVKLWGEKGEIKSLKKKKDVGQSLSQQSLALNPYVTALLAISVFNL